MLAPQHFNLLSNRNYALALMMAIALRLRPYLCSPALQPDVASSASNMGLGGTSAALNVQPAIRTSKRHCQNMAGSWSRTLFATVHSGMGRNATSANSQLKEFCARVRLAGRSIGAVLVPCQQLLQPLRPKHLRSKLANSDMQTFEPSF